LGVIEVDVEVGQDRLARGVALDVLEGFAEAEVTGVWRGTQSIEDPDVEAGDGTVGFWRDAAQVARVGEGANAEAERNDLAMVLPERQDVDVSARPAADSQPSG